NVYDRRLCEELPHRGWAVQEHPVSGTWPTPGERDRDRLNALLAELPDDSLVLVDGLIASGSETLVGSVRRLRIVVLLHMPLAEAWPVEPVERVEAAVLDAAAAVITTSSWARQWVASHLGVDPDRVWTAVPGVDPAPTAPGTAAGGNLLCAGPVTPAKGHDVLIAALAKVADLEWHCTCAGALDLDPTFVESLAAAATRAGVADRFVLTGPLSRPELAELRSRTDLLISPSRRESYGMAVTEGLACGIPVIATDVGGHREAVGQASDGSRPGMLLSVDDADGLAEALRTWLTDPGTRSRWRTSAGLRSQDLAGWPKTARTVAAVLQEISKPDDPPARF
ncbi:MAG TPA: glycosyltransferase family 4 protein, partial [Aeromicrobium sp.]|nr:glycosyltransferase family 4 protein [Aeromicrobium sp.]